MTSTFVMLTPSLPFAPGLPAEPVLPLAPVTHLGFVVIVVPLVYVITDLVHMNLPSTHVGTVSDQLPPDCAVAEVDK